MSDLDRKIFENQLRADAGWPPLHSFNELELRTIRRRAKVREKRQQYGRKGDAVELAAVALPLMCGVAAAAFTAKNLSVTAAEQFVLSFVVFAIVTLLGSLVAYAVLRKLHLKP
mgnify:CR=1 FL=1